MRARWLALPGLLLVPVAFFLVLNPHRASSPRPDPQDYLKPRPRWTPRPAETPLTMLRETTGPATAAPAPSLSPRSAGGVAPSVTQRATGPGSPARSIPGIDAPGLLAALRTAGLACSSVSFDGGGLTWTCSADTAHASYLVVVHGDRTSSITWLRATVTRADSDFVAARFLSGIAALTYSGAEPARAADWVNRTVAADGAITIASVRFELSGAPGARTLDVAAEGLP
jgi:hypothetical protein